MNILFIAPFPPPISGNSLPVKILFEDLQKDNNVELINLNKNSYKAGITSTKRILQVVSILKQVWKMQKNKDLIYFTVSESFAGNMKDLFIYLLSFKIRHRIIIHMFGGAGMKEILKPRFGFQYHLNKYFINKLGAVIVEGQTQADIFSKVISRKKIHIVPNFAEDYLFTTPTQIEKNFSQLRPLKILFLSNFIYGKGYEEILEAYKGLSDYQKSEIKIDFAGGFESEKLKNEFLKKIERYSGLVYHGLVGGEEKKQLYANAHIFCLPTYYPYEGQPFCILEAYATGCVLITTNHSGIRNVFVDGENGYEVEKRSVQSLKLLLGRILADNNSLSSIAQFNLQTARNKYRTSTFKSSFRQIIDAIVKK